MIDHPEGESMKLDVDGGIRLEFHSSKVTSDGGLLAYRDLNDALGYSTLCLLYLAINEQNEISNMHCPHCCVNPFTAVSRVMKMSTMPSIYPLIL